MLHVRRQQIVGVYSTELSYLVLENAVARAPKRGAHAEPIAIAMRPELGRTQLGGVSASQELPLDSR